MDEPESLSALGMAGRERLDNLTFVVNCNLQRLDGPVRGNGKIVQELEGIFRGAGWNVIKVIWGREWDELLARDTDGALVTKMNETVDGEFQKYSVAGGAYIREHFFGPDPRLGALVEHLSDDDLTRLRRGGHDYRKLYAAYRAATEFRGGPTVILAKTIKGWTLGPGVEGRNITHQAKKLSEAEMLVFRDRLELPIPDAKIKDAPYFHPGPDSEEVQYLLERRRALGGSLPKRIVRAHPLPAPAPEADAEFAAGSAAAVSTTMVFAKLLRNLMRDPGFGRRVVPIIPDEARTFGMDPLFREVGIYASQGQRYEPVDSDLVLSYREARDGQVLEEGINEAGSMASFQAAGTSYATHGEPMIPFYIFYSMFGFQRTGDQAWAFADARGRGFMMGATAGRTTLNGEGLQHEDGHSHLLASTVPAIRAYDPAFAYELAAIVRDGIERMYGRGEDHLYYVTLYNENHPMPPKPDGVGRGDHPGHLPVPGGARDRRAGRRARVRLVGSGAILQQALAARELLAERFGVAAEVYSATSWQLLRRDALEAERWNRLHPTDEPRVPFVSQVLGADGGPVVLVSDWVKALPDLLGRWLPAGLRLARHGGLRPERHARGAARALRDRRAERGRGRPRRPPARGRGPGEPGRRGDRGLRDRPGQARPARPVGGGPGTGPLARRVTGPDRPDRPDRQVSESRSPGSCPRPPPDATSREPQPCPPRAPSPRPPRAPPGSPSAWSPASMLAVVLGPALAPRAARGQDGTEPDRTISVAGTGTVTIVPDVADLHVGRRHPAGHGQGRPGRRRDGDGRRGQGAPRSRRRRSRHPDHHALPPARLRLQHERQGRRRSPATRCATASSRRSATSRSSPTPWTARSSRAARRSTGSPSGWTTRAAPRARPGPRR